MQRLLLMIAASALFTACSSATKQPEAPPSQAQLHTPPPQPLDAPGVDKAGDPTLVKKAVCESGKDTRNLEIRKKTSGCELHYTKFGKSTVVSSGKYGTKHCEASLQKITKKLEDQKFKCEGA